MSDGGDEQAVCSGGDVLAPAEHHLQGDLARGTELPMMVQPPFIKPEEPAPATARPAISMGDVFAKAQMREPISKTNKKPRKTNFFRKNVYSFPAIGCRAPLDEWTVSATLVGRPRCMHVSCVDYSRNEGVSPCIPPNICRFMQISSYDWGGSTDN